MIMTPIHLRPATANYTKTFTENDGALMTVEEYLADVAFGGLIDDDGMGDVVKDGLYAHPDADSSGWPRWLRPSDGDRYIPLDATHVLWYNR